MIYDEQLALALDEPNARRGFWLEVCRARVVPVTATGPSAVASAYPVVLRVQAETCDAACA